MGIDFDVIIIGLGAMGSAAAYRLAAGGRRVLGLDRFRPPHDLGSSHGRTRIIREAYFEHSCYVPLVQRAYELWTELERKAGRRLLLQTGGLMIGPGDGVLVRGALQSATDHKLAHETLSAASVRKRFPAFQPTDETAVWEPRAGILFPELAVQSHLELASRAGATLRFDCPVLNWEEEGTGVKVHTPNGSHRAQGMLLSAGAWTGSLLPGLDLPLVVERQVLCWFEPSSHPEYSQPDRCPIFLWEYAPSRFFYGFPDLGDGVKAAIHHEGQIVDPEAICREVQETDTDALRAAMACRLVDAPGRLRSAAVCMYTNTPDKHFILGRHPKCSRVIIASPCSGHGFKFSPVIGEIAAMLLQNQVPPFDLSLFDPQRFATAKRGILD